MYPNSNMVEVVNNESTLKAIWFVILIVAIKLIQFSLEAVEITRHLKG